MAVSFAKTAFLIAVLGKTRLKFKGGTLDSGRNY